MAQQSDNRVVCVCIIRRRERESVYSRNSAQARAGVVCVYIYLVSGRLLTHAFSHFFRARVSWRTTPWVVFGAPYIYIFFFFFLFAAKWRCYGREANGYNSFEIEFVCSFLRIVSFFCFIYG